MNAETFWEEYAWIIRGKQRKEVLINFPEKPITAEELRKIINEKTELKLSLREVSRHLTSFSEKEFLKCLTPDAPYCRLYQITKKGIKIKEEIKN